MDSQSNQQPPAFNVPLPQADGSQPVPEQPTNPLHALEPVTPSQGVAPNPMPTIPQQTPAPLVSPPTQPVGPPASHMPQIADDTDLIEKEWVEKAKQIVGQTARDPYLQNQEINKVKADYLKKRYNKDVKLNEE